MNDYPDTEPSEGEKEMQDAEIQEWSATRDLIVASPSEMVPQQVDIANAIATYRKVQTALDRALPDCLMNIRGKQFRRKSYWRAIATAFHLSVGQTREERRVQGDDWGYVVTYRATDPGGRFADGDGSCFASEKSNGQDTEHNVRGHANTRAYNRAVSNLVGFGEVSAEEVHYDDTGRAGKAEEHGAPRPRVSLGAGTPPARPVTPHPGHLISEPQLKRLYAIWGKRFRAQVPDGTEEEYKSSIKAILTAHGYESGKNIKRDDYDAICAAADGWLPPDSQVPDPKWGE